MPRGGRKGGSARGTPAEQFCTRERAPRPKRGTPVVIIRGPSECFWPRWGSLKFRRHDLEKRSGGSPVIVFHHRHPPAPLHRVSLTPPYRLAFFYVVYRGWNRRENINFSVPRPTYASFLLLLLLLFWDPLHPWDFLGHGSVIWYSTDGSFSLLPQPQSIARIFDHGAFRAFRPGTRRELLPFFSPGAPSVPPTLTERLRLCDDFYSRLKYDYNLRL